jgi:hypothetical protein
LRSWPLLAPTGIALALCLVSTAARSAPRRGARLEWARGRGARACVGAAGLEEDVKARLGWDPFVLPAELEIEGVVTRTPSGFRAHLAFRGSEGQQEGTRELESREEDCRSLGQAVAVMIAVAIDPDASAAAPPLPVETPPSPSAESPPAPPSPPARRPAASARTRARIVLGGGVVDGLVPGPSATSSLRAGVVLADRFELDVGASYLPPARDGAFGFGLVEGAARACLLPWGLLPDVRVCAAALAGSFETYVHTNTDRPVDVGAFPWLGAELGAGLSVALVGPLRLDLDAAGVVPILRRQGFVRGDATPAWEQSPVAGRAELGLGVLF